MTTSDLAERLKRGVYAIDPERVADAMVRAGLARLEGVSPVLVAPQPCGYSAGARELEPPARYDLP